MENGRIIINGILSDMISSVIFYPLNTMRTNRQIGRKLAYKHAFKGIGQSLLCDTLHGLVFYILNDGILCNKTNQIVKTVVSSSVATLCSHPLNLRKKIKQANKKIKLKTLQENYQAINLSLANTVPGTTINFVIRDFMRENVCRHPLIGSFSSFISILATHPIDTLFTCKCIKKSFKNTNIMNGFKERMIEKNLCIGSKMYLFDYLNDYTTNPNILLKHN